MCDSGLCCCVLCYTCDVCRAFLIPFILLILHKRSGPLFVSERGRERERDRERVTCYKLSTSCSPASWQKQDAGDNDDDDKNNNDDDDDDDDDDNRSYPAIVGLLCGCINHQYLVNSKL